MTFLHLIFHFFSHLNRWFNCQFLVIWELSQQEILLHLVWSLSRILFISCFCIVIKWDNFPLSELIQYWPFVYRAFSYQATSSHFNVFSLTILFNGCHINGKSNNIFFIIVLLSLLRSILFFKTLFRHPSCSADCQDV